MNSGPHEIYHQRAVLDLGVWEAGTLVFKVYGLLAPGRAVDEEMTGTARQLLDEEVLPVVQDMGESNDLGFVIIHAGEAGLSISAHWWVQGSVLCQHIYRRNYGDDKALDTSKRPVIACVWELELINAEHEAWRKTMMSHVPDPTAYLDSRAPDSAA